MTREPDCAGAPATGKEPPSDVEPTPATESPSDSMAPAQPADRLRVAHVFLVLGGCFLTHCFFWGERNDIRWYRLLIQGRFTPSGQALFLRGWFEITVAGLVIWMVAGWMARARGTAPRFSAGLARVSRAYFALCFYALSPILIWPYAVEAVAPLVRIGVGALFFAILSARIGFEGLARFEDPGGRRRHIALATAALLILGFSIERMLTGFWRYFSLCANMEDSGLYDQMLWGLFHGHGFWTTIYPIDSHNFMAEHIMPSVVALMPIYLISDSPIILYIAQTLCLAAGGALVVLLARERTGAVWFPLLAVTAYLLYPPLERGWVNDFHIDALEVPLYLGAYWFYLKRRWTAYWVCLVVLLGCKEDVGLSVAALGFWMAVFERRWKIGLATLGVGFLWSFFAIAFLLPSLNPLNENRQIANYAHLGEGIPGIAASFLLRPHAVIYHLLAAERVRSLVMILAPIAALSFARPSTLLLLVPQIVTTVLSNWETQYALHTHYGLVFVGPAFIGLIEGWRGLERGWERRATPPVRRCAFGVALLACALTSNFKFAKFPIKRPFRWTETYRINRLEQAREIERLVPPDARLMAQNGLGALFTHRKWIYIFPQLRDAEYAAFDLRRLPSELAPQVAAFLTDAVQNRDFGLVYYDDGAFLLQKGVHTPGEEREFYRIMGKLSQM